MKLTEAGGRSKKTAGKRCASGNGWFSCERGKRYAVLNHMTFKKYRDGSLKMPPVITSPPSNLVFVSISELYEQFQELFIGKDFHCPRGNPVVITPHLFPPC